MRQKKWKGFAPAIIAVLLFSLFGCVGGGDDRATGTIELINSSVVTIDGFYLAPVDQRSWGSNILGSPLFPGQKAFIVDIRSGFYDSKIRAAGVYSDYFGYLYDILIDDGAYLSLYVYNSSFTGSLEVRNNTTNANIVGLYVVPAHASTWGSNQTSSVIRPSGVLHLTDLTPGLYDVKVVWNFGPDSIYYDIRIDSLTLVTRNVN